ncbi:MAG: ArsA family ATPase [Acidimicrobiales bacterium]
MSAEELLKKSHVLVVLGPGGVGKTTCSAALGVSASRLGLRTVVITVDPAKRLADALGIGSLENEPTLIDDNGDEGKGELWAMMLDQQQTFDDLVRNTAATQAQAQSILGNNFYRNISGVLSGTQEYMAAEKLHQLQADDRFDLIIVDTPPARHALDLLDAPQRLVRFLEHPIYRMLTLPTRGAFKAFGLASRTFLWSVSRVVGKELLSDAVAFFRAFEGMDEGFRSRAETVAVSLREPTTAYAIVTTPRDIAVEESLHLLQSLGADRAPQLVIANQTHPAPPSIELPSTSTDPALCEMLQIYRDALGLAASERAALRGLAAACDEAIWVDIPRADSDIHDLKQMDFLADQILSY